MTEAPAFLRKLKSRERDSSGWFVPCPEHASSGFSVLVTEDVERGRYRLQCIEAAHGDECANEGRLLELLGLETGELGLNGGPLDGPVFVDLREWEMRDIVWVDRPFLATGELVTNNADGDTGKGLLAVHYAARFSRGEFGDKRMVVFAVAEDAYETVLKPRLVAAEANLAYVRCLNWRRKGTDDAFRIPDDVAVLEQHIAATSAGLLVIDPLLSHLSSKTNSHTDHEVKRALQPRQRALRQGQDRGCPSSVDGLDRVHEHAADRARDGLRR